MSVCGVDAATQKMEVQKKEYEMCTAACCVCYLRVCAKTEEESRELENDGFELRRVGKVAGLKPTMVFWRGLS